MPIAAGPRMPTSCRGGRASAGVVMDHSGWSPDYVLRLFRRDKAYFSADLVHERVVCNGTMARLKEPLMHDPVHRLEDALSRMDRYSTAGAEQLLAAGKSVSFMSGISHGLWTFLRTYVLRAGFLDGREGFLLAVANAEGTYYRYMKAWLKGRRSGERADLRRRHHVQSRRRACCGVAFPWRAKRTATSRCWWPTMALRPATAALVEQWKRGSACR